MQAGCIWHLRVSHPEVHLPFAPQQGRLLSVSLWHIVKETQIKTLFRLDIFYKNSMYFFLPKFVNLVAQIDWPAWLSSCGDTLASDTLVRWHPGHQAGITRSAPCLSFPQSPPLQTRNCWVTAATKTPPHWTAGQFVHKSTDIRFQATQIRQVTRSLTRYAAQYSIVPIRNISSDHGWPRLAVVDHCIAVFQLQNVEPHKCEMHCSRTFICTKRSLSKTHKQSFPQSYLSFFNFLRFTSLNFL